MADTGYLVIADITGYSTFLNQAELDHAEEILSSLLNGLLTDIQPPLIISKMEGDAVFAYSPAELLLQGQTLLEGLENIYCSFVDFRHNMIQNTTCGCTACRLMPTLDLKFAVHHGQYIRQQLGPYVELLGNDVNLVHRMLKNHIREELGLGAYLYITQQAAEAFAIDGLDKTMTAHVETFEGVGEVHGLVRNLTRVWEDRRQQRHIVVTRKDARQKYRVDLPIPPALVWDYLHTPELKAVWQGADNVTLTDWVDGRKGVGTNWHCAHGETVFVHHFVDWHPFKYATYEVVVSPDHKVRCMTRLTPISPGTGVKGGTRLDYYVTALMPRADGQPLVPVPDDMVAFADGAVQATIGDGVQRLRAMVEADLASGKIAAPPPKRIRVAQPEPESQD